MTNIPGNTTTTSTITTTGQTAFALEVNNDTDWHRLDLTAGLTYDFKLTGDGGANTLDSARMRIFDATGTQVGTSVQKNGVVSITPPANGTYYLSIEDSEGGDGLAEGNYIITSNFDDTVVNNASTTATITQTGTTDGTLDASGDSDWFRLTLEAGKSYSFSLTGTGGLGSLDDGYLSLLDASGTRIGNRVFKNGILTFTATTSGTYYLNAEDGSGDSAAEGDYRLVSNLSDTVVANVATDISLSPITRLRGVIDTAGDSDWQAFSAVAGRTYSFTLSGDGTSGALGDKRLVLRDANGNTLVSDTASASGGAAVVTYKATTSGPLYLDVQGTGGSSGRFLLSSASDAPVLNGNSADNFLSGGNNATRINGFGGRDQMFGNGGNDRLDSGAGNDLMSGGAGRDVFVFGRNDDRDRITDFQNNIDTIRLEGLGVSSARAALAKAKQVGQDVVFDFGRGDVLVIEDVRKAQLSDDLIFG